MGDPPIPELPTAAPLEFSWLASAADAVEDVSPETEPPPFPPQAVRVDSPANIPASSAVVIFSFFSLLFRFVMISV